MSKTVKETFRDAIAAGDWKSIRRVYKVITGETAPEPPKQPSPQDTLQSLLDKPLAATRSRSVDPMDQPMEEPETEAEEEMLVARPDPGPLLGNAGAILAEDEPPTPTADKTVTPEDFSIQHGTVDGDRTNADGKTKCKKEPMNIPKQRKNLFHDNGKAFADEKVTENPGDVSLGIQMVRPRGPVRDEEIGANTGGKTEVTCGLCGKTEVVADRLAVGFSKDPMNNTYRCNSCSSPNGRAKAMRAQREQELNSGARRSRAT